MSELIIDRKARTYKECALRYCTDDVTVSIYWRWCPLVHLEGGRTPFKLVRSNASGERTVSYITAIMFSYIRDEVREVFA